MGIKQANPTQADKRRNTTLTDKFGRKYFAVIEKESGYPTGLVQCLWDAPHPGLYPPQKYMTFPEDQPGKVVIDYEAWEADYREAEQEWDKRRVYLSNLMPGGANNPALPSELGPRPMSPKVIRAMRQGNRWALGFTTIEPPEVREFFPPVPADLNESVFTETEPHVFTDPEAEVLVSGGLTPSQVLADAMQEVANRCPPNLKGTAANSWAMKELARMAETQEA